MIEDRRVYITSNASPIDTSIYNNLSRYILTNDGKTECLSYTIAKKIFSQVYSVKSFQGAADIFLGRRNEPTAKDSAQVIAFSESLYPQ